MKKRLLFAGLLILSLTIIIANPINADNENNKEIAKQQIGYVDMQKLFQNHPQKKASEVKLEGKAKKLKEELEAKGQKMDKEERQQLLQKYQEQLNQQEQELINGVLADINQKIQKIAEEKGISVVLNKSAVIYGGYNLTAEVLEEIESAKVESNNEVDNIDQDE